MKKVHEVLYAAHERRTRGYTDEVSYFANAGNRLLSVFWITGTVNETVSALVPDIERAVGFRVGEGVEYIIAGGMNFAERTPAWLRSRLSESKSAGARADQVSKLVL